jgi:hypothetical protein
MTQLSLSKKPFGKTSDGISVEEYTLSNGIMEVRIITYGGVITTIHVPDKKGETANVVLGLESLENYLTKSPYLGCMLTQHSNLTALSTNSLLTTALIPYTAEPKALTNTCGRQRKSKPIMKWASS